MTQLVHRGVERSSGRNVYQKPGDSIGQFVYSDGTRVPHNRTILVKSKSSSSSSRDRYGVDRRTGRSVFKGSRGLVYRDGTKVPENHTIRIGR
jgi:hypothetical protein